MKKKLRQYDNEVIIHQDVARIRGTLTTLQSRSMLAILKRANEQVAENPNIKNFTIPTDVFLEDIQNKDTSGTIIKKIHSHLRKLMVQTFVWGTEEELNECVFMQQIQVTSEEVTFIFSDYIREHLKPLSNALIIKDFVLIQSFRKEYARQLYKHLMMWDEKQTLYLSVKDFKEFLGVPNSKSYERMSNLKSKVLNPAIKEINEKCPWMDLRYTNKTKQGSKAIEGFNFSWFKRDTQAKQQAKQQTFTETKLDENLSKYIDKQFYKEGYTWMILAISQIDKNNFQVFVRDVDDKTYTKTFEISKAQLQAAK